MSAKKRLSVGVTVACLALLGGALFGGTADAKKKKASVATVSATVNAPIPDRAAAAGSLYGTLRKTLTVGKKFKGKTVGDVQLTYQTTGAVANAANDLEFFLSAPNGRTYEVDGNTFTGQSIGPVTLTASTPVQTCPATPPCTNPFRTLNPPYVGTARDADLPSYDGSPMKGNWTLTVFDDTNTKTSILNFWKLVITAQKPVR